MNSNKAAICIDNGYFGKLCKDKSFDVYFPKFVEHIAKKNNLKDYTPYIYDCMPHQSAIPTPEESERYAKKDRFFSSLKKKGFVIRLGKLQRVSRSDFKQKKVDTLWTADISRLSYTKDIDTVVIVSGDSDFIPGIDIAHSVGVHTILWYGESENIGTSLDLIKTCKEVHKITDDILNECRCCPQ